MTRKTRCIIFPDTLIKNIIDIFSFSFTLYYALIVPFEISFHPQYKINSTIFYRITQILNKIAELWFICEIIINFITGFWENGQIILSRKRIMERYTSTWLLFDLIAAIPFNLITFLSSLSK